MSLERITPLLLSAESAQERAGDRKTQKGRFSDESEVSPTIAVGEHQQVSDEQLTEWRERVERLAGDQLLDMGWKIAHVSDKLSETWLDHVHLYDVRGLDREGFHFVTTTADMVTRAIRAALATKGYRTQESSQCIQDPYTPSRAPLADYYRVELGIDWSAPLPPEQDNES